MKTVISISLGSKSQDFEFTTNFLGQKLKVQRVGTEAPAAAAGAPAEAAAPAVGQVGRGHRLDHDDHRGVLVPVPLRRRRHHLLGLDGPGGRRRGERRAAHRVGEAVPQGTAPAHHQPQGQYKCTGGL